MKGEINVSLIIDTEYVLGAVNVAELTMRNNFFSPRIDIKC